MAISLITIPIPTIQVNNLFWFSFPIPIPVYSNFSLVNTPLMTKAPQTQLLKRLGVGLTDVIIIKVMMINDTVILGRIYDVYLKNLLIQEVS